MVFNDEVLRRDEILDGKTVVGACFCVCAARTCVSLHHRAQGRHSIYLVHGFTLTSRKPKFDYHLDGWHPSTRGLSCPSLQLELHTGPLLEGDPLDRQQLLGGAVADHQPLPFLLGLREPGGVNRADLGVGLYVIALTDLFRAFSVSFGQTVNQIPNSVPPLLSKSNNQHVPIATPRLLLALSDSVSRSSYCSDL
ncbi:hypothetical protein TRIUR3_04007 [Triticum urartu]|uniref:Uncharacterized protein n=1 Tax=Triticum urartu TaxID=4572 RepID=M7ZK02_TRIUA|nr:hypothetical protein TRIUR3_04007 [Triticum urartu]